MTDPGRSSPHDVRFPGESADYRSARNDLLQAEQELRRLTESLADTRRRLPLGGEVPMDYEFDQAGPDRATVRLSELFGAGKETLLVYSMMFVPADGDALGAACPSCTSILDAIDGEAPHISRQIGLAVSAKAPIEQLQRHAGSRGWRHLRLLSSAGSSYNRDYHAEDANGAQLPMATVFVRRAGRIHHFWSSELFFTPFDQGETRHVDFMWPVWNILDCTPDGRETGWSPQLEYP